MCCQSRGISRAASFMYSTLCTPAATYSYSIRTRYVTNASLLLASFLGRITLNLSEVLLCFAPFLSWTSKEGIPSVLQMYSCNPCVDLCNPGLASAVCNKSRQKHWRGGVNQHMHAVQHIVVFFSGCCLHCIPQVCTENKLCC